jgi:hypothetical protein
MEATDGGRWAEGMGNASYALKIERAHRYLREVQTAVSEFLKRSRRTCELAAAATPTTAHLPRC